MKYYIIYGFKYFIKSKIFGFCKNTKNVKGLIGITLAIVILFIQKLSGGMVNSTLTIILAIAGKIPPITVLPYIVAQVLGGLLALEIYKRWKLSSSLKNELSFTLNDLSFTLFK